MNQRLEEEEEEEVKGLHRGVNFNKKVIEKTEGREGGGGLDPELP